MATQARLCRRPPPHVPFRACSYPPRSGRLAGDPRSPSETQMACVQGPKSEDGSRPISVGHREATRRAVSSAPPSDPPSRLNLKQLRGRYRLPEFGISTDAMARLRYRAGLAMRGWQQYSSQFPPATYTVSNISHLVVSQSARFLSNETWGPMTDTVNIHNRNGCTKGLKQEHHRTRKASYRRPSGEALLRSRWRFDPSLALYLDHKNIPPQPERCKWHFRVTSLG